MSAPSHSRRIYIPKESPKNLGNAARIPKHLTNGRESAKNRPMAIEECLADKAEKEERGEEGEEDVLNWK